MGPLGGLRLRGPEVGLSQVPQVQGGPRWCARATLTLDTPFGEEEARAAKGTRDRPAAGLAARRVELIAGRVEKAAISSWVCVWEEESKAVESSGTDGLEWP